MYRIIGCLTERHDIILVAGAAVICFVACSAAVALVLHARNAARGWRHAWLVIAAGTFGGGVWATHFVAILAYDPGLPLGFDRGITLLSALIAVLAAGGAFHLVLRPGPRWLPACGGAVLGAGVVAMHYAGMRAVLLPGRMEFAPDLVAASAIAGVGLAAAAMHRLAGAKDVGHATSAGVLLLLAVIAVHFTGMGGTVVVPDSAITIPPSALDHGLLAKAIGIGAVILISISVAALAVDGRLAAAEASRLRSLADASFEGIAICDGHRILDVNPALRVMLGTEAQPQSLGQLLPADSPAAIERMLDEAALSLIITSLRSTAGAVPVELRVRRIAWRGRTATVAAFRDLREREAAEARIRYLAHHDPLTDLANRTKLRERMDDALALARRSGESLAILCLDLDRFKTVNDTLGHAAGDRLLRETGRRLRSEVRETDTVARLGGDEFVILQVGNAQPRLAETLAGRLIECLAIPVDVGDDTSLVVTASVGVALYPQDGEDVDQLLAAADKALYRAKADGRNGFSFFRSEMDLEARSRRRLEQDLALALTRGEFSLVYQPQSDMGSGRIVGFEALLRWQHPERGFVPPDEFIAVAEACGAILPIGAWVLREACREAAGWTQPLRLAVNVSPAQFQQGDFVAQVEDTLASTGLAPSRLELEVTEGMFIRDTVRTLDALQRLRKLGVQIAMDDFGTGYSSLSTLRAFPFDRIKIDRSFIRDIAVSSDAAAIVQAVLGLARGLDLPVVAEGVENQQQVDALQQQGCAEIQGYLVSKPNSIATFRAITHAECSLVTDA